MNENEESRHVREDYDDNMVVDGHSSTDEEFGEEINI